MEIGNLFLFFIQLMVETMSQKVKHSNAGVSE